MICPNLITFLIFPYSLPETFLLAKSSFFIYEETIKEKVIFQHKCFAFTIKNPTLKLKIFYYVKFVFNIV